ncbi:unnamed protein product [Periconia digitata]|uniref:Zn(2)-C6 fungal-type domain-containing protein n=1 Tax=Periconia digitata TaxID=1303443 RepID=A0A9W4UFR3_9PLEO|nr:unnamed protein product [Periconia digitata]
MVNRGVSHGCNTCKKRRVKCDESKPTCNECIRVGRQCAGYGKPQVRVRFRDLTSQYLKTPSDQTTTAKNNNHEKQRKHSCVQRSPRRPLHLLAIPESLLPKQLDIAVAFYLRYITDVGRNLQSTRGFLEFVRPVLASESHGSALSTAVNAAATELWALLRPSDVTGSQPIQLHQKALVRLKQAISTPEERRSDAVVLATLVLQHLDGLIAVFNRQEPRSTHREGALALLTQKGRDTKSPKYYPHLLGNLLHSKISFCVRNKIPLAVGELMWLQTEVIPTLPDNPSSQLDVIGISVSRLQNTFCQLESQGSMAVAASGALIATIQNVDAQLRGWLHHVPDVWRPRRIPGETPVLLSIFTYHDSCDIYPSVQVANIWNTWRTYRLIVESIRTKITRALRVVFEEGDFAMPTDELLSDEGETHRETPNLIESICRSIPFYLGSFTRPLTYSDIHVPLLVFPSYHDLRPDDPAFTIYKNSDDYASKEDHCRHTALHGPLHALTILSSLMDLLSEQPCPKTAHSLINRQKQWVKEQLNRCLYLTRLDLRIAERIKTSNHLASPGQASAPEEFAQAVRRALTPVTIL